MKTIKLITTLLFSLLLITTVSAQQVKYKTLTEISYRTNPTDEYAKERCKVDIYYPESTKNFKTIVWFHGGGLVGGSKDMPALLKERGICIVSVNYRLSPRAKAPAYIDDAAAAIAWTFENIAKYGGDTSQIYVGGHSAGGFLAFMVALDPTYLGEYGVDPNSVKAYYPVSGQTSTHHQIKDERGEPRGTPVVDKLSPLGNVRANSPRILFTAGQKELELEWRTVENQYLYDALRQAGNTNVELHVLSGFDHGNVVEPSMFLVLKDMGVL